MIRPPAGRAPWTLQRRLVLLIVALLTLVTLVVGVVSTVVLRGFLVERLDAQLASATQRGIGPGDRFGEEPASLSAARLLNAPGQAEGTLAAVVDGTGVVTTAGYLSEAGTVTPLVTRQLGTLIDAVTARIEAGEDAGTPATVDLGGSVGEYRVVFRATAADGVILGVPLASVTSTVNTLALVIAIVGLAGVLIAVLAGGRIVSLALRPLQRVTATAERVATLPLGRGDVALAERVPDRDTDTRTEVGRVGAAVNRMLGHVEESLEARAQSESKVRRFVADASHELRTPLASIRGYSELTRRMGGDLPPDVVHAVGRIESEALRMTGLVEDLLLLARLDEGRELRRDTVDLTRIVVEATGDAGAAAPDHEWRVEVPDEPVEVIGDEPRLRQVVVNLLANARVHTPPGTVVTASVAVGDGRAHLVVADDGPGVDPAVAQSLFERFTRADSSRSRAAGSTGLGLAIVRGVVDAHGGEVSVRSVPGDTRFEVSLPVA